jgi:hypothetical protein
MNVRETVMLAKKRNVCKMVVMEKHRRRKR